MKTYKTDGQNRVIFSKDMKVAELVDADFSLLSILLRMDMQLPFGDLSVEELCRRYGISVELFLMICQVYSTADYLPDVESLKADDLKYVIKYLRASHRLYLGELLPSIGRGVERVLECCEKRQRDIVSSFYQGYCEELRAHLEYEEQNMFPYVESLLECKMQPAASISQAMEHHTDICEKIDDIKSILIKYLPEECTLQQRYELLRDVYAMSEDLARHTLIEVKILAPVAARQEQILRR